MKSTMRNVFLSARLVITAALCVLAVINIANSKLLGNPGQLDAILAELVAPLDTVGIDVVAGNTAGVTPLERARIARLSGMPPISEASFERAPWMSDFLSGATGFVAAAKTDNVYPAPVQEDIFLMEWQNAPQEKRVFLSFTSTDITAAERVAAALRERGYVTFIFWSSGDTAPRYSPYVVGTFFTQAAHHFVLDTDNARRSRGVWLEARTYLKIETGSRSAIKGG